MSMRGPVLLYDGLCGLCDRTVQVVLRADRRGVLRFAPLQGEFAARVFERHPEVRDVDSLILVEPDGAGGECVRVRSDAALALARYMGGAWPLARTLRIVPGPLRDAVYDLVARTRYRIFGRRDACRIPTPQERARFLD
jgi:predicted DCC family thiol-disulfide oxidoreductase YuxK